MKVLVTGANGQLGFELQKNVPESIELQALTRQQCDISDAAQVNAVVADFKPDVIINAAAYTNVDQAEAEPEIAYAVNATGAENMAKAAVQHNCRLIHVSTDFVFDGQHNRPYRPDAPTSPLGEYGKSKLAGEMAVQKYSDGQALIIRTAWVYSAHGKNFVKTILHLLDEKEQLGVIADQVGTPTWANNLAKAIWAAAFKPELKGYYHFSDAGIASWYDFAAAIQTQGFQHQLIKKQIPLKPIQTEDYPLPAKRPAYSVLEKQKTWQDFAIEPMHWQEALTQMLAEIKR